ncbi:pyridoxal-phosphate dependent enzyme [Ktedonosporobacter rubrisoli]|uniref:Pyridoxal-phosphate dependent enzyme n=1 Tax=Ktedonosporobacter rubrisoli TaxID=2509675 RepID=A0A4P6JVC2_KTERU|nr:pyridoxal-phosphate dependent enzyme [Ktedonosporobacter rubrisoli]QBD78906.1 pyridoxal-phosphate dependent enzyme [Ktedonosporobacter rubrisoli]
MEATAIADLAPVELNKLAQRLGNTPLEPIYLVIDGIPRKIHLKLESENPTGSVKDRTGYGLIQAMETRGLLGKGSIVIESTSGNLGVALSFYCKLKGYSFIAVVDPKTTQENLAKMQALGAKIEMVDQPDENGGYLLTRLAHIQELCDSSAAYVWTNQYGNPANPHIHYLTTGPEIYRQMHGKIDALFMAVSTGGTLAGVGRFFREASPATTIVGVDAYGSIVFGGPAAPRKLTGIGSSRASSFLTPDLYDTHMLVRDEEAFAFCRTLWQSGGNKVGGSSGAVLAACAKYLQAHPEVQDVVCVCADGGENYANSIFNDAWLQQQGLNVSQEHLGPVQDILYKLPFMR